MLQIQSKLTSQGQVSVPVEQHATGEVHQALFTVNAPVSAPAKILAELKQGVRQRMQHRYQSDGG